MSFIQFESGREKDRMRMELREARNDLLKQAEERSKLRDERKVQKMLQGDDQWMLPSVSKKLDANAKLLKKSSKKKKEKKKSRKKSSDSSSTEEEIKKKKKRKKRFSSESSSEASQSEDEWIEKKSAPVDKRVEREDWLSGMLIPTFSNKEKELKKDAPNIASYDPKTSSRELNPFWKDGGNGMPTFQKPKSDSDDDGDRGRRSDVSRRRDTNHRSSGWRKRRGDLNSSSRRSSSKDRTRIRSNSRDRFSRQSTSKKAQRKRSNSRDRPRKRSNSSDRHRKNSDSRDRSSERTMRRSRRSKSHTPKFDVNSTTKRYSSERNTEKKSDENSSPESKNETVIDSKSNRMDFLTDQQMNELGAKILKSEILGNDELANSLKEKLEKAREYRNANKSEMLQKAKAAKADAPTEEYVMLTKTNNKGISKPLSRQTKESDLWGGRAGRKKNKKVETHVGGERVRYFADDDKYDIKQMFENEKFTSAADQDEQFANIAGKSKNPNDDLDDIFADKVRKEILQSEIDDRDKAKAIRQHEELKRTLDSCDKCFESPKMEKQLIVSMGDQVYVSLPWHEGLQIGHCMIIPMQHVACSTQLDEDVWSEVQEYRKAITRMFESRKQDVIFFETVRYLHKNPHMVIHVVPNSNFELAPFYFKKAIQESEREWSTNKQLIQLKDKDIRRSVPKGLPYFWVNFGMAQGLAHVIEEQDRFPSNFAQETIGGLLNLDARLWRRPRKESNPIPKVKQFADWWKPFEIHRK